MILVPVSDQCSTRSEQRNLAEGYEWRYQNHLETVSWTKSRTLLNAVCHSTLPSGTARETTQISWSAESPIRFLSPS